MTRFCRGNISLWLALGAATGLPNLFIIFKNISEAGILTAIVFSPATAKSKLFYFFP